MLPSESCSCVLPPNKAGQVEKWSTAPRKQALMKVVEECSWGCQVVVGRGIAAKARPTARQLKQQKPQAEGHVAGASERRLLSTEKPQETAPAA